VLAVSIAANNLDSVCPRTRPMMSHAHRRRSSEAADTILSSAQKPGLKPGPPPPRPSSHPVINGRTWRNCPVSFSDPRFIAPLAERCHLAPRRPSRTSLHKANQSLRAKATIHGLRVPRAFSVRGSNHLRQGISILETEINRHANWSMPRRTRALPERAIPFLATLLAALVSSGDPVETPHSAPTARVAPILGRSPLHQQGPPVSTANPDHARHQAHHDMSSITVARSLRFKAGPFGSRFDCGRAAALHVVLEFISQRCWAGIGSPSGVSSRRGVSTAFFPVLD